MKGIIRLYFIFALVLIFMGIWNYFDAKIVTYDIIATSVVLIVVGLTLGVSIFNQSWIKAAIFVDGLVFFIMGLALLSAPYNYIFVIFGVLLLVLAILAYMEKLPSSLLKLFYKS